MKRPDLERSARRGALSGAVRGLRRKRQLSVLDAAARMGMTQRTYERFEAGDGRVDVERLLQFAEVTDADPVALLCAIVFHRPELALRFCDNKLMWIGAHSVERFSQDLGEAASRIEAFSAICAFDAALRDLTEEQLKRSQAATGWLSGAPVKDGPSRR